MPTTVTRNRTQPQAETKKPKLQLTGDALISFISGTQTNIGREDIEWLKSANSVPKPKYQFIAKD